MKHLLVIALSAAIFLAASPALTAEPLRHIRIESSNSEDLALQFERQGFDVLEGSVTETHL